MLCETLISCFNPSAYKLHSDKKYRLTAHCLGTRDAEQAEDPLPHGACILEQWRGMTSKKHINNVQETFLC